MSWNCQTMVIFLVRESTGVGLSVVDGLVPVRCS